MNLTGTAADYDAVARALRERDWAVVFSQLHGRGTVIWIANGNHGYVVALLRSDRDGRAVVELWPAMPYSNGMPLAWTTFERHASNGVGETLALLDQAAEGER